MPVRRLPVTSLRSVAALLPVAFLGLFVAEAHAEAREMQIPGPAGLLAGTLLTPDADDAAQSSDGEAPDEEAGTG